MSQVLTAFDGLLKIADTGAQSFSYHDLHPDHDNPEAFICTGIEFIRTVRVPVSGSGTTVAGTASLRIIRIDDIHHLYDVASRLYLRARVSWTSPLGRHGSFAAYDISAAAAAELAKSLPDPSTDVATTDDEPEEIPLGDALGAMAGFVGAFLGGSTVVDGELADTTPAPDGHWAQLYPYNVPAADWDASERPVAINITEIRDAHEDTVRELVGGEPELLCMLSGNTRGIVQPSELPALYAWATQQPEANLV